MAPLGLAVRLGRWGCPRLGSDQHAVKIRARLALALWIFFGTAWSRRRDERASLMRSRRRRPGAPDDGVMLDPSLKHWPRRATLTPCAACGPLDRLHGAPPEIAAVSPAAPLPCAVQTGALSTADGDGLGRIIRAISAGCSQGALTGRWRFRRQGARDARRWRTYRLRKPFYWRGTRSQAPRRLICWRERTRYGGLGSTAE